MIVRCVDVECTGLNPETSGVLEIGWTDVTLPDRTISDPQSYLCGTSYPITPENRAVHHISPYQIAGLPEFDADAFNAQCVEDGVTCLAAHNANFDAQFVRPTLPIICTYKAALRAWPDLTSHSNSAVFYALEDQGRCEGANYAHIISHRAGPDSYVTAWILRCLLEDGHSGRDMVEWTRQPAKLPRCPIGKHRGKPWAEVDAGWLKWCVGNADIGEDVRYCARAELEKR